MKRSEYRAITTGRGAQFRAIYLAAANRHPPSRSQLYEMLTEAGIEDSDERARIVTKAVELAKMAQDGSKSRLVLHAKADAAALAEVRALARGDSLLDDDRLHGEEREDELLEHDRIVQREADRLARRLSAGWDADRLERVEEGEKERERLGKLGIRVER